MAVCFHTLTALPGIWSERSYDRYGGVKKAKPSAFKSFWARQPDSLKNCIKPCKGDPRWAILERTGYVAERALPDGEFKRAPSTQKYVVCIDPKSRYAGNLYNDDEKKMLALKFFNIVVARPFHLIAKLVYHLSLAALIVAIVQGIKKHEKAADIGQRVFRSLMGILRTPLYELVLLIVAVVGLIVAPLKPTLFYDFRAFLGRLSHEFYWGKRQRVAMVDLHPCMWRVGNLMDFEGTEQPPLPMKRTDKVEWKIEYEDPTNPLLVALDNKLF